MNNKTLTILTLALKEGVLTFSQITPIPKSIELKISGIGDVVRSFVW